MHLRFQIKLQLDHGSTDYDVVSYHIHKLCVCGDSGRSFKFVIIPTSLGKINLKATAEVSNAALCDCLSPGNIAAKDTVVKKLLVEV